ncbi:DUF2800 domain-containing protein [bacterium]|nr:DUF2800 domain-containing protein [bacterium]
MSDHAQLAPSSAPQWGHCAGSVRAQAAFPDIESEQSREGTAAHWVMAEVLLAAKGGATVTCAALEGQQAPNGVVIDEKMCEGAQIIVDDVLAVADKFNARGRLLIEHRVHMPQIHPTANWGTLDVGLELLERNVLFIWDYKHGHRDCPVEGNLQLVNYLAGLVHELSIDGIRDRQTTVVARIVQPFCYYALGPVKEWVFNLADLRGWFNKLSAQAHEALSDSPTLTTGKWCRDCKAVGTCAPARMAGYNYIELANAPYDMDAMTGADLAVERGIIADGLAVAKARLEAVEDELGHRVRNGETDSGLALETGQGREAWTIPPAQAIALVGMLGVDAAKQAVLTPTQTRAAAPKEVRPMLNTIMANVTRRPPGKLKLVQASETKAARAFQTRK